MTKSADLIAYLFNGQPHPLSGVLTTWLDTSPRYVAFVETYRDKIRKKLRVTRDAEGQLDVLGELELPYHLLTDRRLEVVYEPYASLKRRGPDFAVTYRTNLTFNIELSRIHLEETGDEAADLARKQERILRLLLDKLGQMQAGRANLLVIHARGQVDRLINLSGLIQSLKARVDGRDPKFFLNSQYDSPTAFYKDFLHLSGMIFWTTSNQVWGNKQSKFGLPEKVLDLVRSLLLVKSD